MDIKLFLDWKRKIPQLIIIKPSGERLPSFLMEIAPLFYVFFQLRVVIGKLTPLWVSR